MSPQCPQIVDPERLAEQHSDCQGTLSFDQCQRLVPLLLTTAGEAQFAFHFAREPQGRLVVTCYVQAVLTLQCQRCSDPLALTVNAKQQLAVVKSLTEAELLPEHLEPLLIDEDRVNLHELVEEELLLALPVVPRHELCQPLDFQKAAPNELEPARPNPFGILATLKKTND
jgi:uncharacterized protein